MCSSCAEQIEAYRETIKDQQEELDCLRIEVVVLQSKVRHEEVKREYYAQQPIAPVVRVALDDNALALSAYLDDCQY